MSAGSAESKPKVSIVSIAYNQANYIERALDSFLMQDVDFTYEIIIADDASTDATQEIIRNYAKKYPRIIKPILRKKNVGIQTNLKEALLAANGEYVALCEGDDYWTDRNKLKVQVDFLDKHPTYSLCFHPVRVIFEKSKKHGYIFPATAERKGYTAKRLLAENYIQTNSAVYRKQDYAEIPTNILPLDWYLHLFHAQFGKIGFIDKVMSVYRIHPGGVWWEAHDDNQDAIWQRHGFAHIAMYDEVRKLFGANAEYAQVIEEQIIKSFHALANSAVHIGGSTLVNVIVAYPKYSEEFILRQNKELFDIADEYNKVAKDREYREEMLKVKEGELITATEKANAYRSRLETIESSRTYKLLAKIVKLKSRIQNT